VSRPDFDELVGSDLPAEDRARLERVHQLLLEAGPPPELSPALERAPKVSRGVVSLLPRRRRATLLVLAASLAAAAFGGGYLAGHKSNVGFKDAFVVEMRGTPTAPAALADVHVGGQDASGNWPMLVVIRGLKELPPHGYYELWLTRGNRRVLSCGTFKVHGPTTSVELNTPVYARGNGWVIVAKPADRVVMTTLT
jgi:hypothetical protein